MIADQATRGHPQSHDATPGANAMILNKTFAKNNNWILVSF
jgi:hypothetical protein